MMSESIINDALYPRWGYSIIEQLMIDASNKKIILACGISPFTRARTTLKNLVDLAHDTCLFTVLRLEKDKHEHRRARTESFEPFWPALRFALILLF